MKHILLATAAVLALVGPAGANSSKGTIDYGVMGVGNVTCAKFAAMYRRQPEDTENAFFSWAQGYMSAINVLSIGAKLEPKNLAGWTVEDEEAFMRSYCNAHPLAMYMNGVDELMGRLPDSTFDLKSLPDDDNKTD